MPLFLYPWSNCNLKHKRDSRSNWSCFVKNMFLENSQILQEKPSEVSQLQKKHISWLASRFSAISPISTFFLLLLGDINSQCFLFAHFYIAFRFLDLWCFLTKF